MDKERRRGALDAGGRLPEDPGARGRQPLLPGLSRAGQALGHQLPTQPQHCALVRSGQRLSLLQTNASSGPHSQEGKVTRSPRCAAGQTGSMMLRENADLDLGGDFEGLGQGGTPQAGCQVVPARRPNWLAVQQLHVGAVPVRCRQLVALGSLHQRLRLLPPCRVRLCRALGTPAVQSVCMKTA